jgi:DNA-directed RNA polymerase specialized sigma24 family protein
MTELQRTRWTLHRQAFDQLLQALGPDRDSAGQAYERLRQRLVKFFSWERCPEPEACADESLNRIARAIDRGEIIQKMDHYALGVARLVLLECKARERKAASIPLAAEPVQPAPSAPGEFDEADETELALGCLERCIRTLEPSQRTLLLEYYRGSGKSRIDNRRQLAEQLGIELNALRNRAMRLRERVETCVRLRMMKLNRHTPKSGRPIG